mmetsp:Transcript_14093/g.23933  ORF Transcript_14093/g.23933 Transcript_14093/m.23933 type:complete len:122 (+) Transcript_14093:287-652(+)
MKVTRFLPLKTRHDNFNQMFEEDTNRKFYSYSIKGFLLFLMVFSTVAITLAREFKEIGHKIKTKISYKEQLQDRFNISQLSNMPFFSISLFLEFEPDFDYSDFNYCEQTENDFFIDGYGPY